MVFLIADVLAAPSSPVGLPRQQLVAWLGDPNFEVELNDKEISIEYIPADARRSTLSKSGLLGFGFVVNKKTNTVVRMLARYDEEILRAQSEIPKEPISQFFEEFDMSNLDDNPSFSTKALLLLFVHRQMVELRAPDKKRIGTDHELLKYLRNHELISSPNNELYYEYAELLKYLERGYFKLKSKQADGK